MHNVMQHVHEYYNINESGYDGTGQSDGNLFVRL